MKYKGKCLLHFLRMGSLWGPFGHAVQVLSVLKRRLEGRKMTACAACRPAVENPGAECVTETLHVDGNLVSGHACRIFPVLCGSFPRC